VQIFQRLWNTLTFTGHNFVDWLRLAGGGIYTEHRAHGSLGTCLDLASPTWVGFFQSLLQLVYRRTLPLSRNSV
jgi:hypothetical protein